MGQKYYARFSVAVPGQADPSEYDGVVEVKGPLDRNADEQILEALIAKGLEVPSAQVQLLDWGRLH
jgi:hypothetical protein